MLRHRLYLLAAALLWSTGGAAIKRSSLDALQVAGGRSLVAAAFLFLIVSGARKRPSRATLLVSVAYAATVVLFVIATKATTAANAIFLQDTAPLWILLLSPWLLKERPSRGELLAAPVFLLGLGLFFVDKLSPGQTFGNLVAIASGVAFAFCIMGLRHLRDAGPVATAWGNLLAALICSPFVFSGPVPTPVDVGLLLFLGVFQLGVAYAIFSRGVTHVPAVEASLLILIEPVLNPVWAFLFAGERPGPWAVAGGLVILGATGWRTAAGARSGSA